MGQQRDPYQEEIQWLIPLKEFFYKFNCREYRVKSKDFKIIDRAISRLRDGLCWFGKYFCSSVWHRVCKEGDWWVNTSDIGRKGLWLEGIIGALDDIEDLVEEAVWVDESSYLSQEWRKLEDDLRSMIGLPSEHKPAAAADSEQQPFAAPPTTHIVELSDESAKKVARLTGAEVKKFIKPGRGSKNTRFPNETKEACVRIWEKYKGNPEVMKLAQKRKVSHKDVFICAKGELEEIGIHSAEEYDSALGAASDKKHRESPAVKEKKPQ